MSTAKKALTGTFFVAINTYLSMIIYLITGVILTRILTPTDYGTYYISVFFAGLFSRTREFGFDKALVHKQDDLDRAYRTHFTLQLIFAIITLLVAIISAPLIIGHYPSTVFPFVIVMCVSYAFLSLSSTQRVSLEKNLLFDRTTLVDLVSLALSQAVAILLAYRGFGAMSLVVGFALNYFIAFVMLWIMHPWRISFSKIILFDKSQVVWFLKFGFFLFLGGLTTFALYKYNDFLLGTFVSLSVLGFYSRASNYSQIPTMLITSVISRVAFPTYSVLQKDKEKLSAAFSIVLKSIVRISFPLSLALYLVADDFTYIFLGAKWLPMVPIFRILIIYGVLRSVFDDLGELFTAVGKPRIVSFYLFVQALVGLGIAPVLISLYKANGAAVSLSLLQALGVILAYKFLSRVIKINIVGVFLPTIAICVLTMLSFKVVVFNFSPFSGNTLYSLIFKGLVFGVSYLIFMALIDGRQFIFDLKFILSHLNNKEPNIEQLEELEEETVSRQM